MTKASEFFDPFNGRPAQEWHHVTGRDSNGRYFNKDLVIAVSITTHNRIHQSWGVEYKDGVEGDPVSIQISRLGTIFYFLGESGDALTRELPTAFFTMVADALFRIIKIQPQEQ